MRKKSVAQYLLLKLMPKHTTVHRWTETTTVKPVPHTTMESKTNNEIFIAIGTVTEGIRAINSHLAILNGSVAKLQDKSNNNDIINAQTTLSQQQMVKELAELKEKKTTLNNFWYGVLASIGIAVLTYFLNKGGL